MAVVAVHKEQKPIPRDVYNDKNKQGLQQDQASVIVVQRALLGNMVQRAQPAASHVVQKKREPTADAHNCYHRAFLCTAKRGAENVGQNGT